MVLDAQQTYDIGLKVQIVSCTLNTLASLLTLYAIWLLPKSYHNGYLTMILFMTISQTLYDASLLFYNTPEGSTGYNELLDTCYYLGILFGTNSALWTSIISGVTSYVIWTRRYIAVQDNMTYFNIFNFFLSFVIATSFIVAHVRGNEYSQTVTFAIYNYARLLIIVFDVLAVNSIFIVLKSLQHKNSTNDSEIDTSYYPMYILAKRLMLYPVVQTLSRIPVTIYQLHYNETISEYPIQSNPSAFKTALLYIGFCCTPMSGIGNCIVFFTMQKGAWKVLKEKVWCSSNTGLSAQEETLKPDSSVIGEQNGSLGVTDKSGSLGFINSISSGKITYGSSKSRISLSLWNSNVVSDHPKDECNDEDMWRQFDELDDEELSKAVATEYRDSLVRYSESRNSNSSRIGL